jgi:hypothetical protein
MDIEHGTQNRRKFIRQLGKTLGIGLGVALLPASRALAHAQNVVTCCPNDGRCAPRNCQPNGLFYCLANAGCPACCICDSRFSCFTTSFCPC